MFNKGVTSLWKDNSPGGCQEGKESHKPVLRPEPGGERESRLDSG